MNDELPELMAASKFRDLLIDKADGRTNGFYPWWYGWAIVEAFRAGARWQRERKEKTCQ